MSDESKRSVVKKPVSSSNSGTGDFDAVVVQNDRISGPVRLPMDGAECFVEEFNSRYSKIGISVRANEKSPATSIEDIAGDGWSVDSVGQRSRPVVS